MTGQEGLRSARFCPINSIIICAASSGQQFAVKHPVGQPVGPGLETLQGRPPAHIKGVFALRVDVRLGRVKWSSGTGHKTLS